MNSWQINGSLKPTRKPISNDTMPYPRNQSNNSLPPAPPPRPCSKAPIAQKSLPASSSILHPKLNKSADQVEIKQLPALSTIATAASDEQIAQANVVLIEYLKGKGASVDVIEKALKSTSLEARLNLYKQELERQEKFAELEKAIGKNPNKLAAAKNGMPNHTPEYFIHTLSAFLKAEQKKSSRKSQLLAVLSSWSMNNGTSPLTPILQKLAHVIQHKKTHEIDKTWLTQFVKQGGIALLAEALCRSSLSGVSSVSDNTALSVPFSSSVSSRKKVDLECEFAIIACCKVIVEKWTTKQELPQQQVLNQILGCFLVALESPSLATRVQALDSLTMIAKTQVPDGHFAVMSVLDQQRLLRNDSHSLHSRKLSQTSSSSAGNVANAAAGSEVQQSIQNHDRESTGWSSVTDQSGTEHTSTVSTTRKPNSSQNRNAAVLPVSKQASTKKSESVLEHLVRSVKDIVSSRGILGSSVGGSRSSAYRPMQPSPLFTEESNSVAGRKRFLGSSPSNPSAVGNNVNFASGTANLEEIKEYILSCLTLINTIINTPKDVEYRSQLRLEAVRGGLLHVFEKISTFARDEFTHINSQIEAFRFYDLHDKDLLRDSFRRKIDLGDLDDALSNFSVCTQWLDLEHDSTSKKYLSEITLMLLMACRTESAKRRKIMHLLSSLTKQVVLDEKTCKQSDMEAQFGISLQEFLTMYVEKDLYDSLQDQIEQQRIQNESSKKEAAKLTDQREEALNKSYKAQITKLELELSQSKTEFDALQADCARLEEVIASTGIEMETNKSSLASRLAQLEAQLQESQKQVDILSSFSAGHQTAGDGSAATSSDHTSTKESFTADADSCESKIAIENQSDAVETATADGEMNGIMAAPPPPPPPPPPVLSVTTDFEYFASNTSIPPPPPPPVPAAPVNTLPPLKLKCVPNESTSFRPLLLDKIPDFAISSTLWSKELDDSTKTSQNTLLESDYELDETNPCCLEESDFKELESIFGDTKVNTAKTSPPVGSSALLSNASTEKKPEIAEITFLDPKRAQMVAISSKALLAKFDYKSLNSAIENYFVPSTRQLGPAEARALLACAPTDTELQLASEYAVAIEQEWEDIRHSKHDPFASEQALPATLKRFRGAERLFYELGTIRELQKKLEIIHLYLKFMDNFSDWKRQAEDLDEALQTMLDYKPLHQMLQVLRDMVNFIQLGNGRKMVYGFRVSTLPTLEQFKAPKADCSIVQYFVRVVERRISVDYLLELCQKLQCIIPGSRVDSELLAKEVSALLKAVKYMRQYLATQADSNSDDFWAGALLVFDTQIIPELEALSELFKKVEELLVKTAAFYGENATSEDFAFAKFFGDMAQFAGILEKARIAERKREHEKMIAERRQKMREQMEEKMQRASESKAAANSGLLLLNANSETAPSGGDQLTMESLVKRLAAEKNSSKRDLTTTVRETDVETSKSMKKGSKLGKLNSEGSENTLIPEKSSFTLDTKVLMSIDDPSITRKNSWENLELKTLSMLQQIGSRTDSESDVTSFSPSKKRDASKNDICKPEEISENDEQYILDALLDFTAPSIDLKFDFGSFGL